MSGSEYESAIENSFGALDYSNFTVLMTPPKIFFCGGPTNTGQLVPQSLRERIINYLDIHHSDLFDASIVAENFSDYFKDGAYKNLLQFEEDIANISSLIVICLESAGSLVEFGMFCNRSSIANKLLVYVSSEDVKARDSFIFLGPLTHLKSNSPKSVSTYPKPSITEDEYEHIEVVVGDLISRLDAVKKTEKFDQGNSGHLALLIHDIVSLAEPIKIQEIEKVLEVIGIQNKKEKDISRLLYLLEKMNLVQSEEYSHVHYYYVCDRETQRLKFGRTKSESRFDRDNEFISIRRSFVAIPIKDADEPTKKRMYVTKVINKLRSQN